MSFTPKSYSKTVTTSSTRSTKVDDGKKKSLLKDNSWIRANVNEEEQVERESNFGKTVLSRYKSNESLVSPQDKTSKTESKTSTVSTSSDTLITFIFHFSNVLQISTSTTTTTIKDGAKITETTVTTTKQDVVKSSTKSETLTDKDLAGLSTKSSGDYKTEVITIKSSKDTVDGPTSPLKTTTSVKTYTKGDVSPTKSTTYSVRSTKSTEDQLFDTLIPTSIKSANTASSDYKTEVVTVKTSKAISDVIKSYTKEDDASPTKSTTYSVRSTKSTEDQLFDTLIPTSIKSANTDSSREDVSVSKSIRTVYSTNERDEWSTVTSPSYSRTSYSESRPADYLSDTLTSKTTTTVYTSPERVVSGKDICTVCHKNMYTDEKIILDDMNINCHASCFKCGVCNASLGLLKAGDSLWVYRRAIHCESCFGRYTCLFLIWTRAI
uniref:LIM zinc-binding domain-containing protein n=1 Tax=Cyprinus carpio TaxID=7962 RepID=A0A8C2HVX3_CYPCA